MLKPYLALPRAIHVLCLGTFVNRAGTFLVPFLTLYLTSSLGLGSAFATTAMGLYGFGGIVAALTGGHLADRIGRRTVMLISLLGASSILLFFGRLTSPPAILAAVLAFSFLGEMYRPAASAMVADLASPEQRPTAFGLMYLTINLGMVVSPVVGGFIAERSYQWLFYGDAGTSTAYALLLFFAVRETLPSRRTGVAARAPSAGGPASGATVEPPHPPIGAVARQILGHRVFLLFCVATHLVSIAYMQSHTTLPLYLKGVGFGPQLYGLLTAVNAFLIVCFQLPFTSFIARFRRENLLVASAVVTALGFGLTGLATTYWPLAGTVVVWTLGEMMQSPYLSTVVADLAPRELRGTYMGMLTLSFASALMIGAPLGGLVFARFGAGALWGGACAIALVGAVLYAVVSPAVRRAHASVAGRAIAGIALAAGLAALPVTASAGDEPHTSLGITLGGGVAAQAGTLGDVYQPTGWLLGAEVEWRGTRPAGFFALDYCSFDLRRPGHVVDATKDTLLGGAKAGLLLYRIGGRRYLRGAGRWSPYLEQGIGLGAANAPFETSDTSFSGGGNGTLVGSLFVGAGVRTRGSGPVSGFAGVRLDAVRALFHSPWGLVPSVRLGCTVHWNSMTGLSRRTEAPQVWTDARSLPRTYDHLKLWPRGRPPFWNWSGTLGKGGTLTVTVDSLVFVAGDRRHALATSRVASASFVGGPAAIEVVYFTDDRRSRTLKYVETAQAPWKGHARMELLEASIREAMERSRRSP